MFSLRPPKKKAINKIVTGFVVDAEKQENLPVEFLANFMNYLLESVRCKCLDGLPLIFHFGPKQFDLVQFRVLLRLK